MLALRRNIALEIVRGVFGLFFHGKDLQPFPPPPAQMGSSALLKGAAYLSCSHSEPELVISIPLWLFLPATQDMSLRKVLLLCAHITWN